MKVVAAVVHVELKAVDVIALDRLSDQRHSLLAHCRDRKVEAVCAVPSEPFVTIPANSVLGGVLLVPRGAAHPAVRGRLHEQAGVELHAACVRAIDDDRQRIEALGDEMCGVLVRPPKDRVVPSVVTDGRVGPILDVITPELADLGVVQHRPPIAEAEAEHLHRCADELVDAVLVLLLGDGRLVHVDEWVAAVVIVVDCGRRHRNCCGASRRASQPRGRKMDRGHFHEHSPNSIPFLDLHVLVQ